MSSASDRRTQAQVFHYWQLYKTSAQYLSMMEGQLVERQRQRRLQGALRAWRAQGRVAEMMFRNPNQQEHYKYSKV